MYPRMSEYDRDTMHMWLVAGFTYFEEIITALEESVANFAGMFYMDYKSARPIYTTEEEFVYCFQKVLMHNAKKYEIWLQAYAAEYDPIENYSRHEVSGKTRTPDITNQTDATTSRNQTRTTTETPTNYTETTTTKVAPFDSTTLRNMEESAVVASGSRATTENFTGDPDEMSSTTTTTGTDTEEFESTITGNIGVSTSQMMLNSSLDLAERMKLCQEIERDIAKELLLQVWN